MFAHSTAKCPGLGATKPGSHRLLPVNVRNSLDLWTPLSFISLFVKWRHKRTWLTGSLRELTDKVWTFLAHEKHSTIGCCGCYCRCMWMWSHGLNVHIWRVGWDVGLPVTCAVQAVGPRVQSMYWQIGACSPSSPVTNTQMFTGGGKPLASPKVTPFLRTRTMDFFGLPITTTLPKVLPVFSPSFEGSHSSVLWEAGGCAASQPRSVIITVAMRPGNHWHQKLNGFLLPGVKTGQ